MSKTCRCFWIGYAITLVCVAIWPLLALFTISPFSDAARWTLHSTTFFFYHLFLLPIVVGLFVSAIRRETFVPFSESRLWNCLSYLLLFLFFCLMTLLVYLDAVNPGLQPIYLANATDRAKAFT